jgi:polar amino acid transport system ATP-binding protein
LAHEWSSDLPRLDIQDLEAKYDDGLVLDGISLSVEKGEVVSLIGASGSGKSTLLRALVGLVPPHAGSIALDGDVVNFRNPKSVRMIRDRIAIVFQQYNLFQNMSALQNVMIAPVKIKKRNKAQVQEEAAALLEKVGLSSKLNAYPEELSGGQQQRVAIARALCLKPQILLLDEVTSALDPELVQEVLDIIKLLASEGTTMLIVSHEMGFVREVSSRVAFLSDGKLIEVGKPEDIFDRPKVDRTREFVGRLRALRRRACRAPRGQAAPVVRVAGRPEGR